MIYLHEILYQDKLDMIFNINLYKYLKYFLHTKSTYKFSINDWFQRNRYKLKATLTLNPTLPDLEFIRKKNYRKLDLKKKC